MHTETQQRETSSITRFCAEHEISRAMLYKLWGQDLGPRIFRVGRKVLISREAAEEWRRRMEERSAV